MKKILFLLQVFIKCFIIFLVFFIWLRYILDSVWLSILISFTLTVIIEIISLFLSKRKGVKTNLKQKEKEDAEKMFYSLASDTNYINFFFKLAKSRHQNIAKYKKYIYITHQDNSHVILYPYLKFQTFNLDDLILLISSCKKPLDKIVIICNDYDKNLSKCFKNYNFEILLLNKYETYQNLYKEYDYYPEITTNESFSKTTLKDMFSSAFNYDKSKGYFVSAIILFIASLFVSFNIYYSIFASILLIFSLISLANKNTNKKIYKEIL